MRASVSTTVPSRCPDGEQPAVGADGVADEHVGERVAMRVRPDAEHAAQPPVAGEVPDDDLAVKAAGVERAAVGADRQAGDLRGVLWKRLADRPAA